MISQYDRVAAIKQAVNVRRYNKIVCKRRLRLASFVSVPRLVKGYHNNPRLAK